jgi:predicted nucleic acid-binding protein
VRHYFLDASAVVKLYAVEAGSRRVKDMIRSATAQPASARIVVAGLTHPEAVSGITKIAFGPDAARRGLSPAAARRARVEIASTFGPDTTFTVVEPIGIMPRAAELVWRHRIKASDAIQLATALYARTMLPDWSEFYFVGSDGRQNSASLAEGLAVIDPTA